MCLLLKLTLVIQTLGTGLVVWGMALSVSSAPTWMTGILGLICARSTCSPGDSR